MLAVLMRAVPMLAVPPRPADGHRDEHWSFPAMHSCAGCGQSLMELAVGVHTTAAVDRAEVHWLALAGRCVACGRIDGLTDLYVDGVALDLVADLL